MQLRQIKPLYWLIFIVHSLLWNTIREYKVYMQMSAELGLPAFCEMNWNALSF